MPSSDPGTIIVDAQTFSASQVTAANAQIAAIPTLITECIDQYNNINVNQMLTTFTANVDDVVADISSLIAKYQPNMADPAIPVSDAILASYPPAPTVSDIPMPSLVWPDMPDTPSLQYPTLVETIPTDDLGVQPFYQLSYNESAYESGLLDSVNTQMKRIVESAAGDFGQNWGSSYLGFSTIEETALFERSMDKEENNAQALVETARHEAAKWGHPVPPGALTIEIGNKFMRASELIAGSNREITTKRAELFRAQWMDAFKEAIALMVQNRNYHVGRYERILTARKYLMDASIAIVNAMIQRYNSRVQAWLAQIQAYTSKLKALETQVDIFKAEAEVVKVRIEANAEMVRVVIAQLEAQKVKIEIYRAQVEAESTEIRGEVDVFNAKVREYEVQVQALTGRISSLANMAQALGQIKLGAAGIISQQVVSQNADLLREMELGLNKAKSVAELLEENVKLPTAVLLTMAQASLSAANANATITK